MKKNLFKYITLFSFIILVPISAHALQALCPDGSFMDQTLCGTRNTSAFGTILLKIQSLLNSIIGLLVLLGVVYFVWGVVQYVIGDSEEAKKKGRDRIIYGIIGFAVIVSVWGLVNILVNTFGLESGSAALNAPQVNAVNTTSASCTLESSVKGFLDYGTCLIGNSVIPFIFALAILMFLWGAVKFFIINADEEAKREQGKQFMIWGIVALAVMVTVWSLVGVLGSTFGFHTNFLPNVKPQ